MLSFADGKYIPTEHLALPVAKDPLGTFRGLRIFTACRTVGKKVFRLEDHIERLFSSARELYMPLPHDKDELRRIILETVAKNQPQNTELLLEIIYSGGQAGAGGFKPAGRAYLYILVLPLTPPPGRWYEQGIRLAVFPYQRQWPEVKLLNYIGGVIAHQTAVRKYDADEALFVSPGQPFIVLEGTTFNFFAVKQGVLITHPLDGKILPGITRKVVLELVRQKGLKNKEDYFSVDDLREIDEAFITSSTRNIVPVATINDISIGKKAPGEITSQLSRVFKEYQIAYES